MKKILYVLFALFIIGSASSQPVLNTPALGSTNLGTSFAIGIGSFPGATSYDIELSEDGSFVGSAPSYQAQLNGGRSFTVSNLKRGQTYFLRWRANNSSYATTVITTANLVVPSLSSPTAGAIGLSTSFNIAIGSVAGATTYDIELSLDGSFTGIAPNYQASINSSSRTLNITGLSNGQTYAIRWRARNSSSNSAYGSTSISTGSLAVPSLLSPTAGATGLSTSFNIAIGSVSGATTYDIELSIDGSFTGTAPNYQSSINSSSRTLNVTGLNHSQSYSIRWRARNSNVNSSYGNTTVTTTNLAIPSLISPSAGANGLNVSFNISIGSVTGATAYDIELSLDGSFVGTAPNYQSSINSSSRVLTVSGLNYGQTYSVRWRARNTSANSAYGSTSLSTQKIPEITVSNLISGTYFNSRYVTLTPGSNGFTAVSYDWEFDTSSTFSSPALIQANTIASNSGGDYVYDRDAFISGARYYVRIRVNTANDGSSDYSFVGIKNFFSTLHLSYQSNHSDGVVLNRLSTRLTTPLVNGATDYRIEISKNADFSNALIVTPLDYYDPGKYNPVGTLIEKSYEWLDLDPYTDYYVRTISFNVNQSSEYGPAIRINSGGASVVFSRPLDGSTNVSTNTAFAIVFYSGATIDEFEVVYSKNADFTDSSTFRTVSRSFSIALSENSTYYAKIKFRKNGVWYPSTAAPISFSTAIDNALVRNLRFSSPANGATGVSRTANAIIATFTAQQYGVEISTNADFTGSTTILSTSRVVALNLNSGTLYYARLRALISGTWYLSTASAISFTTSGLPPRFASSDLTDTDNTENKGLLIYPNPSNAQFNIKSQDLEIAKSEVLDLTGRILITSFPNEFTTQIGEELSPGRYILKLTFTDESTQKYTIVKQ